MMPARLVDKILEEIDWPAMINWEWINDPLCDPRIYEFMRRAKKLGMTNWVTTTGQLLDDYHAARLLEGSVDVIVLSIDTLDARKYRKIRRGADLEVVLRNVERLVDRKERLGAGVEIWVSKIWLPWTCDEDAQTFVDFFAQMGIRKVQQPNYRFRGGELDTESGFKRRVPDRMQCYYIENEMAVTTDGNVALCACEAGAWDEPESNIENLPIRAAWLTPRRLQTIKLIRTRGLRGYDACREHEVIDI